MFRVNEWRDKRNLNKINPTFGPLHYQKSNYSTGQDRTEMKHSLENDLIKDLHIFPEHLQKNLADTMYCSDEKVPINDFNTPSMPKPSESAINQGTDFYRSLAGITNIFAGVFNLITGSVFQRRPQTPASDFNCFEQFDMDGESWQDASMGDQNKNGCVTHQTDVETLNMSLDCRTVISQCEDKIDKVRQLLCNKTKHVPTNKYRRRPKKVFVEPSSIEEKFEDAFSPEDFVNLANETYMECISPFFYQAQELFETESPKMIIHTDAGVTKSKTKDNIEDNKEIVSSCEDKLLKLKAMLQERKNKARSPEKSVKSHDKRYKNPERTTSKRSKASMKQDIINDMLYAHEIASEDLSSAESSPNIRNIAIPNIEVQTQCIMSVKITQPKPIQEKEYFDEISGRFHSTSTDSDDSFQIVFSDSPKVSRRRQPSDCESEDSFIVFEESPDSCYASVDVFGDQSDEESDSESEISDSGCEELCKLDNCLTRTVNDLTNQVLYDDSKDEVDCVFKTLELPKEAVNLECSKGLLIDDVKKRLRRNQPSKKVHFSTQPAKVHVMRVWTFAAKQARIGNWERDALDRERFKRRIADVDMAVSWVLKPQHRSRVMFQRFMPWWNAQKRKELAEKKLREEESKKESDSGKSETTSSNN